MENKLFIFVMAEIALENMGVIQLVIIHNNILCINYHRNWSGWLKYNYILHKYFNVK
jgi:hypothetical protein